MEITNCSFSTIKASKTGAFGYMNANNVFKLFNTKIYKAKANVKGGFLDIE